ncbi:MAG: UDP-3-O-acyl-N-acetylglucosamine deacetylase [Holosporales bacterium]|jgi:UDP-3-O-[3-hydroxymyristoyl] N-acetylglucosamine deacetylase|nr:UDP-3-O-acyl-N-acetylglucosamine deacetylase [Holosporales bacterium]
MSIHLRPEATVGKVVSFSGIGVHSGQNSEIRVMPAPENLGVIFKRTDVTDKNPFISLSPDSVVDPVYCTRIRNKDDVTVAVVEHLLAAFRLTGITNALVEIDAGEVPIMDGSASVFVEEINRAGIVRQNYVIPMIVIKKPVVVESQNGRISIKPSKRSRIKAKLDYDRINPVIGDNGSCEIDMDTLAERPDSSESRLLAMSRTFGWVEDQRKVQNLGLGLGASEANTVGIMGDHSILNEMGLRHHKELVMHKCLDLIGDLFILGCDIMGDMECLNPSHQLNNQLMKKVIQGIGEHEVFSWETRQKVTSNQVYRFA